METWPSVPFGSWRLWDAKVAWPDLEPDQGEWNFERLDGIVARASQEKIDLLLPLGLTPAWAASRPQEPSAYRPGLASPARNASDWRRYVDTIATRYGGRIKNFEIWNEPNLRRFFSGTVDDYLALARVASEVLRARVPGCRVVGPSVVGPSGLRFLDEFMRKGGGDLVDVVSVHVYAPDGGSPEWALDYYRKVREILAKHGHSDLPIWNTECGFQVVNAQPIPADGRSAPPAARTILSQAEASDFLVRTYAIAAAEGVERVYWYAWDNLRFGLVEPDGVTEKKACSGFRFVERALRGATSIRLQSRRGGIHDLVIYTTAGQPRRMIWTAGKPESVTIEQRWRSASALRSDGPVAEPRLGTGARRIQIRGAPLVLKSSIRFTEPVGRRLTK